MNRTSMMVCYSRKNGWMNDEGMSERETGRVHPSSPLLQSQPAGVITKPSEETII